MKMIFISSTFTDEIQSHFDCSEADVLPPSSSEEERIDKTQKYQKEYHRKYCKRSSSNHICVDGVEKLFLTALKPKNTKNLKDVKKQKTMFCEISCY